MRIFCVLLLALLPAFAHAAPPSPSSSGGKCIATPSLKAARYPGRNVIVTSNDLALPEGKAVYAPGQRVYVYGRVLDKNCVPVSDAIVEIWQTDPDGKYVTSSLSDRMNPYPHFAGSGRAVTDNLGQFTFVTLFPGAQSDRQAPHINFHIVHSDFPALNTAMFFSGDSRNIDDKWFNGLSDLGQSQVSGKVYPLEKAENGIAVKWDVILDGINPYRKY